MILIQKELCNPIDAYTIPGPYYHIYIVHDDGELEFVKTEESIEEAARYAERVLDFDKLALAYENDPSAFSSAVLPKPQKKSKDEDLLSNAAI